GYVEGRTYVLEPRWTEGRTELFPSVAAELVRLNVYLIVSAAGPAAPAVNDATASIPPVLAASSYPGELGGVASLAHPGGNVTGMTHFTPELMAKRVQLLKEAAPTAERVALLRVPGRLNDLSSRAVSARPAMSIAFSRAPDRPTFPSSSPRGSSWRSTSAPPGRSS